MASKIDGGELSADDFYVLGIFVFVQFRSHFETIPLDAFFKIRGYMTQLFMDTP